MAGFLGAALLSRRSTSHIHFVDIVPELMAALENKLHLFYPDLTWKTHCIDVAKLPLGQHDGNHLIIIAGVGGDLMIQFIEAINKKHPHLSLEFLLCPVQHQYALRQKLIELDFGLKDEVLVEENKRFYEIIHVTSQVAQEINHNVKHSTENNTKVTTVGDKIWQYESPEQEKTVKKYLNNTLNHYLRVQQGKHNNAQEIVEAYQRIVL